MAENPKIQGDAMAQDVLPAPKPKVVVNPAFRMMGICIHLEQAINPNLPFFFQGSPDSSSSFPPGTGLSSSPSPAPSLPPFSTTATIKERHSEDGATSSRTSPKNLSLSTSCPAESQSSLPPLPAMVYGSSASIFTNTSSRSLWPVRWTGR